MLTTVGRNQGPFDTTGEILGFAVPVRVVISRAGAMVNR